MVLKLLVLALATAPILPASAAGAPTPPGIPVLHQSAELVSQPLGAYSRQGSDVALSADGSTLAIGSVTWSIESPSTVVVRVRSSGRWLTQATLRAPVTETLAGSWGSAVAISADGDTLAITNPGATVLVGGRSMRWAGVVHVFSRSGQTWRATGDLVAPKPEVRGWFGSEVSLSGDGSKLVVSSVGSSYHAYVGDTGSLAVRELPAPAESSFGYSVAISPDGETVAVGAPYSGWHPGYGAVFVLVDDPVTGWTHRWTLEPGPDQKDSHFGAAVAVNDSDTVVVGAPYIHRGVAVFDRRGADLVRTAWFTPRYVTQGNGLGSSVAVSADGSTVVAGAPFRAAAGGSIDGAGAGYRWVRRPGGWAWAGLLSVAHPHAYEYQGDSTAVSADGRVVVLGATGRSSARRGVTGAAIVFSAVS